MCVKVKVCKQLTQKLFFYQSSIAHVPTISFSPSSEVARHNPATLTSQPHCLEMLRIVIAHPCINGNVDHPRVSNVLSRTPKAIQSQPPKTMTSWRNIIQWAAA